MDIDLDSIDVGDYKPLADKRPKKIVMVKEFLNNDGSPRRSAPVDDGLLKVGGLPPRATNRSNFAHARKLSRD